MPQPHQDAHRAQLAHGRGVPSPLSSSSPGSYRLAGTLILSLWAFNSWATSCPVGSSERWYVGGCETGPSMNNDLSACAPIFDPSILNEVGSSYEDLANRIEAHLPISRGGYGSYTTSVRSPGVRLTLYLYRGPNIYGFTYVSVYSNCVCNRTLSLDGGGDVDVGEVLPNQNLRVLSCGGQPEANVAVEILATPADPVLGPSGGLRAVGGSGSGTSALSALTDSNGEIKLEFLPPAVAGIHALTARCTDPNKPCSPDPAGPKDIRVHECPIELSLIGGGQVEHNEPLPNQMLRATNCRSEPVNELAVEIKSSVQANTGGHQHHDNDRPKGTIIASRATTNENGEIPFSFKASAVAGTHEITARCTDENRPCNQASPVNVDVMVEGLTEASNGYFQYTGETDQHPYNNHSLRPDALARLRTLSKDYFDAYGDHLCLNDASLEWGGLFDLDHAWTKNLGHKEHQCGSVIDIRAGKPPGTPEQEQNCRTLLLGRETDFIEMASDRQIDVLTHEELKGEPNAHYHLYLLTDDFIDVSNKTCKNTMPPLQ